jgi:hypothetical protein
MLVPNFLILVDIAGERYYDLFSAAITVLSLGAEFLIGHVKYFISTLKHHYPGLDPHWFDGGRSYYGVSWPFGRRNKRRQFFLFSCQ